ncbi:hypothetical protein L9F63_024772 [Diploptera punctata]|uniref:Ionotropic glutamate receptor C-terminal domain-containing protein n=1 Tax=Diploptera punctata TaxID=6984 RepID=A0AAD7ZFB8_DIPPU|nr:hypothetical protein L9F63_024772 [Diploptera punctata]
MKYSVPKVNSWGWKTENETWTGMIGMIEQGEVHMGASAVFITQGRAQAVDFTMPLLDFGYTLFIEKPNPYKMAWNSLISPFTLEMWWTSCVSLIVITIFLWLALHHPLYNNNKHHHTLTDLLMSVIGIFFQQGNELCHQSISIRIVILTATLTAFILYAGYSATLLSFLTTDVDEMPFRSLQEFLDDGQYKLGCIKDSAEYFFLRDSEDPLLQRAFTEQMNNELPETNEKGIEMICNSSFAFLAPEKFILLMSNATCNIRVATHRLFTMYLSFPIQKNSPYRKLFDRSIHALRRNGMLIKLWTEVWPHKINTIEENWISVGIKETVLATTVLLVGAVISIIIALVEKLLNRKTKQNNDKPVHQNRRRGRRRTYSRKVTDKEILYNTGLQLA